MRTRKKLGIAPLAGVSLMPGAPEKGTGKHREQPYQEPALVPLGEKPKV